MSSDLYAQWLAAKERESQAVAERRMIEDLLVHELKLAESFEGTASREEAGYIVKITARMNRKVDADLVQELAAEHGLSEHLPTLFRWTPELNMKAWKSADETITAALAKAITIKPGRPSFQIQSANQE